MIVIIGTGLAGYQTAREIRKINAEIPLTLVTADDGRFYPKPQLSNAMTSKKNAAMIATADADMMAKQLNAVVLTHSTVTSIDTKNKNVFISEKKIPYTQLVLACGADVINAPLTGSGVSEVLSINHIYHYAQFEKRIQNKKNIAILGVGLIGCEFANDLSNAGYEVDIIAPDQFPLQRFLPEKIGRILQTALEQNGVRFHLQCTANQVEKQNERFLISLSNGKSLETDFVLSAIGLRPHVELARTAALKISRGIIVNRFLETSQPDVYAIGDCAEVEGHVLPFITPILNCSRGLAKTLVQERTAVEYPAMPITVKTPAHPLVICPPPAGVQGEWQIESSDNSHRALFYVGDQLFGFVLTQAFVKERLSLVMQIPKLF